MEQNEELKRDLNKFRAWCNSANEELKKIERTCNEIEYEEDIFNLPEDIEDDDIPKHIEYVMKYLHKKYLSKDAFLIPIFILNAVFIILLCAQENFSQSNAFWIIFSLSELVLGCVMFFLYQYIKSAFDVVICQAFRSANYTHYFCIFKSTFSNILNILISSMQTCYLTTMDDILKNASKDEYKTLNKFGNEFFNTYHKIESIRDSVFLNFQNKTKGEPKDGSM